MSYNDDQVGNVEAGPYPTLLTARFSSLFAEEIIKTRRNENGSWEVKVFLFKHSLIVEQSTWVFSYYFSTSSLFWGFWSPPFDTSVARLFRRLQNSRAVSPLQCRQTVTFLFYPLVSGAIIFRFIPNSITKTRGMAPWPLRGPSPRGRLAQSEARFAGPRELIWMKWSGLI